MSTEPRLNNEVSKQRTILNILSEKKNQVSQLEKRVSSLEESLKMASHQNQSIADQLNEKTQCINYQRKELSDLRTQHAIELHELKNKDIQYAYLSASSHLDNNDSNIDETKAEEQSNEKDYFTTTLKLLAFFAALLYALVKIFQDLKSLAKKFIDTELVKTVGRFFSGMKEKLYSGLGKAKSSILSIGSSIKDAMVFSLSAVKDAMVSSGSAIKDSVVSSPRGFKEKAYSAFESFKRAFKSLGSSFKFKDEESADERLDSQTKTNSLEDLSNQDFKDKGLEEGFLEDLELQNKSIRKTHGHKKMFFSRKSFSLPNLFPRSSSNSVSKK